MPVSENGQRGMISIEPGTLILGVIVGVAVVFLLGLFAGMSIANEAWEKKIRDHPDGVAVIRSRLKAEQAERDLWRNQ